MATKYIVVFDLDGTLCDVEHRLHHIAEGKRDWDSFNALCVNDPVVEDIAALVHAIRVAGLTVVFLTGRSDEFRGQTWEWLCRHNLGVGQLVMRPKGNYAPDTDIKMKLAALHCGFNNILFAVEDRDKVVAAWRANGVTCLQCKNGAY